MSGSRGAMARMARWWNGRRVLVTGHTGFKGGWLTALLHDAGARVFGYALPPDAQPNLFEAARIGALCDSELADIRDLDALAAAMRRSGAEVIFHLAARALVGDGYRAPAETFATNVLGTANVLEAARRSPAARIAIVATSDKCYAPGQGSPAHREEDALGGSDPYGVSKACAEMVAHSFRTSFPVPDAPLIATVRAGNVIGGGDWAADRLLPDAVRAFGAGRTLLLRNPDAIRPWQHVLDALSGYVALAERLLAGEAACADAFNFGPDADAERCAGDVAARFAELWGGDARWRADPAAKHPPETPTLRIDNAKARRVLGWRPGIALDEALARTADWHRAHMRGEDMQAITLAQIRARRDAAGAAA